MSTKVEEVKAAAAAEDKETEEEEEEREEKQYSQVIKKISESGAYEFEYVEGPRTGERIKVPRQKISNRMMLELEEDRADYASIVSHFSNGKITREQRHEAAKMLTNLYAKLAKCYFHIEREDFDRMDWDSTKPNIDAAANVSVRGRPNLA
jgi:hypothetical protein